MTCIVALVEKGVIWMGGDSAITSPDDTYEQEILNNPKIFARRDGKQNVWLIGSCGDFRGAQLLEHSVLLPDLTNGGMENVLGFIVTQFIPNLRSALRQGGALKEQAGENDETDMEILIGLKEQIFYIDSTFQVLCPSNAHTAIGSGRGPALGALGATEKLLGPEERILVALEQSQEYTSSVREPFLVLNSADAEANVKYVRARRRRPRKRT